MTADVKLDPNAVVLPVNDQMVLICGKSTTGKSASLRNLRNPEGVMYLNCEAGKRLPFRSKFMPGPDGKPGFVITNPWDVYGAFDYAEQLGDKCHTIVVDSLTYLLEMYVSQFVIPAADGRAAWGGFAQFYKNLMQQKAAPSTKQLIFTAHTLDQLNETEKVMETKVPVQGSLKNMGIESYFSTIIATKRVAVRDLKHSNKLLNITEQEKALGFKHVFQTQPTKDTIGERIRGPMGLFDMEETFIDNDAQLVLDQLVEFYD